MRSTFNKGDVIFRQGDAANSMFDILSGSVGVYMGYGTEHETQVTVLNAGDFLGEMGLIECYPRSATAVAMEDGTALQEIGEKEFSEYFNSRPMRLLTIMQQLSAKYPTFIIGKNTDSDLGRRLNAMGYAWHKTKKGSAYRMVERQQTK